MHIVNTMVMFECNLLYRLLANLRFETSVMADGAAECAIVHM